MDSDDDIQKPPLVDSDDERKSPSAIRPSTSESDKETKKRMEKERKEQEKREREESRRRRQEEKMASRNEQTDKENFLKKSFNQLSGFFSQKKRVEVRPKEGVKCRVSLLDGSEYQTVVDKYAYGQHLFDKVCDHINLIEKEYFSLTFVGKRGIVFWLIHDRRIIKQMLEDPENPWTFEFRVKFYTPEPTILQEDITRYLLCLQLRSDISSGKLPCSFVTYALLGSYTAQSELGDYEPNNDGRDTDYLQDIPFAPNQTEDLLEKIVELHKTHFGQTPADAELNFLENAKKLQMYGMHFVQARDSELVLLWLGVYYGGIVVVRDNIIINKFPWPKILKISYNKRKKFYIKIRPAEFEQFENTIGFQMESHTHAKNFWRLALEHHTFFRLKRANEAEKKNSNLLLQLGSRHRYSGKTQYQTRLQRIHRSQPEFERNSSRRTARSLGGESSNSYDRHGEAWITQGGSLARPYYSAEGTGEKVSVLAGTATNVNKLAYVKTVKPGSGEPAEEVQFEDRGREEEVEATMSGKGKKKKKVRPRDSDGAGVSSPVSPGPQSFSDTQESLPPYYDGDKPDVAPKPKTKKKKGSTVTSTVTRTLDDGSTVTEYRTERTATIESRSQREITVPYSPQSIDYDQALSQAIQSVTDVDHELAVKKIQLETDQLKKTKKKKKKAEAGVA